MKKLKSRKLTTNELYQTWKNWKLDAEKHGIKIRIKVKIVSLTRFKFMCSDATSSILIPATGSLARLTERDVERLAKALISKIALAECKRCSRWGLKMPYDRLPTKGLCYRCTANQLSAKFKLGQKSKRTLLAAKLREKRSNGYKYLLLVYLYRDGKPDYEVERAFKSKPSLKAIEEVIASERPARLGHYLILPTDRPPPRRSANAKSKIRNLRRI